MMTLTEKLSSHRRLLPGTASLALLLVAALTACGGTPDTATPTVTQSSTAPPAPKSEIGANALHANLRLGTLTCALPEFGLDATGQDRFVRAAMSCLDAAWLPVLSAAGIQTRPVQLVVVEKSTQGCEGDPVKPTDTTFYCNKSGTVYWAARDETNKDWGPADWTQFLFVAMHEYSHHVQNLAGVSAEADQAQEDAGPDTPESLLVSRRIELQAQCLAGMAASAAERGSVASAAEIRAMVDTQAEVGDGEQGMRTHGNGDSNRRWATAGYRDNSTSSCDTWSAAPNEVD